MNQIAPPPPAATNRPIAFYDTECYPNYWLLRFKVRDGAIHSFSIFNDQSLSAGDVASIRLLFDSYCAVSFNGNFYDVPMIAAALGGYSCSQLKEVNDNMIVNKIRSWHLNLPKWEPSDHIDIMEVAPGAGGQKQYAGRIHCKTMQDLPYSPDRILSHDEMTEVFEYCGNDLSVLEQLYNALRPQLDQRDRLSERYGIDLRSKSDAQLAEAVLKKRCEDKLGYRVYKPEINYNLAFRYQVPEYISYTHPQLQNALNIIRETVFTLSDKGAVRLPPALEGLEITIGGSTYALGNGGLHSQEKRTVHYSDDEYVLLDNDVASYYPSMMLQRTECPPALGPQFLVEFGSIKSDRIAGKAKQKALEKQGIKSGKEYEDAHVDNEGGKVMINGTFGKTGSPYSVLFAPEMMIQTTVTGQLSLLMIIEWHEAYGIPVVSANTDGIVIKCPRKLVDLSKALIAEWEKRTGLEMETVEYKALYSRDINNYFAIKTDGTAKRKGEYSKAGLNEKKNPDVEICSDAVAEYLTNGTPVEYTIAMSRDIRKFVVIQKVNGGAKKLWGHGPVKGQLVRDMVATLTANGWRKDGRFWSRLENHSIVTHDGTRLEDSGFQYHNGGYSKDGGKVMCTAQEAYASCFTPQRPEELGKVIRWYYSTEAPGPIVYCTNGNLVGGSYGAHPLMTLPDEFPTNIDYEWYINKSKQILVDIGKSFT